MQQLFVLIFLSMLSWRISQCAPAGGSTVPDLVDESQVSGLEEFLTELEPDLRQLVIQILTIYERAKKDQIEGKLRDLMQQQPYELLDRLFDLYKKARRKETMTNVAASNDYVDEKYIADK